MVRRGLLAPCCILALTLLALGAPAAHATLLWIGSFRVLSADPWQIVIVDEADPSKIPAPFWDPEVGLPYVTPDKWICRGRLPQASDVGKTFKFDGTLPDIAGAYHIHSESSDLVFESIWHKKDPMMEDLYKALWRVAFIALGLVTLIVVLIMVWRGFLSKTARSGE